MRGAYLLAIAEGVAKEPRKSLLKLITRKSTATGGKLLSKTENRAIMGSRTARSSPYHQILADSKEKKGVARRPFYAQKHRQSLLPLFGHTIRSKSIDRQQQMRMIKGKRARTPVFLLTAIKLCSNAI